MAIVSIFGRAAGLEVVNFSYDDIDFDIEAELEPRGIVLDLIDSGYKFFVLKKTANQRNVMVAAYTGVDSIEGGRVSTFAGASLVFSKLPIAGNDVAQVLDKMLQQIMNYCVENNKFKNLIVNEKGKFEIPSEFNKIDTHCRNSFPVVTADANDRVIYLDGAHGMSESIPLQLCGALLGVAINAVLNGVQMVMVGVAQSQRTCVSNWKDVDVFTIEEYLAKKSNVSVKVKYEKDLVETMSVTNNDDIKSQKADDKFTELEMNLDSAVGQNFNLKDEVADIEKKKPVYERPESTATREELQAMENRLTLILSKNGLLLEARTESKHFLNNEVLKFLFRKFLIPVYIIFFVIILINVWPKNIQNENAVQDNKRVIPNTQTPEMSAELKRPSEINCPKQPSFSNSIRIRITKTVKTSEFLDNFFSTFQELEPCKGEIMMGLPATVTESVISADTIVDIAIPVYIRGVGVNSDIFQVEIEPVESERAGEKIAATPAPVPVKKSLPIKREKVEKSISSHEELRKKADNGDQPAALKYADILFNKGDINNADEYYEIADKIEEGQALLMRGIIEVKKTRDENNSTSLTHYWNAGLSGNNEAKVLAAKIFQTRGDCIQAKSLLDDAIRKSYQPAVIEKNKSTCQVGDPTWFQK